MFSFAFGLTSVALPLLAISVGYSGVEIGVLTAVAALSQMATRLVLGPLMRIFPDWILIVSAGALLAGSNIVVAVSASIVPFVIAELLQGVARACFWTGSQTHVVRGQGRAVGALARVNLISSFGLLGGPVAAGLLAERSAAFALAVGAGVAAVGMVPGLFLDRLPPFSPPEDRPPGLLWRRPGVDAGCWAGATAGAWRAMLGSYVPVALHAAQQSSSTIGALVAVANFAAMTGSGAAGRLHSAWIARSYAVAAVATGVATGAVALVAGSPWAVALALAVSGLGAGTLQTVGPAVATEAVHPQERGDAIAVAGTFRAGALFLAPLGVAGLVSVAPLTLAMATAGALMTLPVLTVRRLSVHLRPERPVPQEPA